MSFKLFIHQCFVFSSLGSSKDRTFDLRNPVMYTAPIEEEEESDEEPEEEEEGGDSEKENVPNSPSVLLSSSQTNASLSSE